MRRVLSFCLTAVLLLTLLSPITAAAQTEFGTIRFSEQPYMPHKAIGLEIYVPLLSGGGTCTLTIYDQAGVSVAQFEQEISGKNVYTFFWDAKPAIGNAAGYSGFDYAPAGVYLVKAVCGNAETMASFTLSNEPTRPTEPKGLPNYTGDHEVDYMVSRVLEEAGVYSDMTKMEKMRAIYSWVQGNCYRNGEDHPPFVDPELHADAIALMAQQSDYHYEVGDISYDAYDNLYTENARKILMTRVGTCLEFSALVQVMLAQVGIECWIVGGYFHNSDGTSVIHKWNYVRINDTFYWSDVRIDNASYERSGRTKLYYDYFLEEDTELWAERHSWDREEFPEHSTATPVVPGVSVWPPVEQDDDWTDWPDWDEKVDWDDYGGCEYPLLPLTDLSEKTTVLKNTLIMVDGVLAAPRACAIDGYNFFKLRDLAYILSGSDVQFEVGWLQEEGAVTLLSGLPYTPVGMEDQSIYDPDPKQAVPTPCTIYIDGEPIELAAYLIEGNHYFRLRDIGILFDFLVEWDEIDHRIHINTVLPYYE
ncbi:MAG: hypothetical protein E7458_04830 [Ruminococcaceae bacterium]|nr:hypothetical protein [Oscillospiraceae bacterium]